MTDSALVDVVGVNRVSTNPMQRALGLIRAYGGRVVKTGIGLTIVGFAAVALLKSFVLPVSTEAVVAGSVTTLRAPIDGMVTPKEVELGSTVKARQELASITNPWEDDGVVRDLRNRLALVEAELATLQPQRVELEAFADGLRRGVSTYQLQRVNQLKSLLAESTARQEADRAQEALSRERHARAVALFEQGVGSQEQVGEAERDRKVAEQTLEATTRSIEALVLQQESARQGTNVDGAGMGADRPYSRQRLDEVTLELIRIGQRVDAQTRARDTLQSQLESAQKRLAELSSATLVAAQPGRIWKIHAAKAVYVTRGQPVVSVLACDHLLVVAVLKERVFEKLRIGGAATFTIDHRRLRGRIVQLEGLTRTEESDLVVAPGLVGQRDIPPTADPYRVTISVPELRQVLGDDCSVGRPGEVTFD